MKVKNIAFSGFMAAILMGVTGAHAADTSAVRVATKAYVDGKTTTNATAISNLSTTVSDHISAYNTYVADNNAAVASKVAQSDYNTTVAALNQKDLDQDAAIALKADQSALDTLAGDVYRKAQTYTQDEVKAYVSKTLTDIGEGNISLEGYAKTQDVNNALSLKADKTQVATDIASAITSANGYTDAEIAKLSAEGGAITAANAAAEAAQTKADSAYELADAAQTAGEVQTAITGAITGLDLANTYEAKGTAANLDAALKSDLEGQIATAKTGAETVAKGYTDQTIADLKLGDTYEAKGTAASLDAALKSELQGEISTVSGVASGAANKAAANETAIATNAANIAKKQDALSEAQLAAAGSGITAEKVDEYDAAVLELTNKISMPEACKQTNGNCVLGIMNQKVQWIDLTEPVTEPEA